MTLAPILISVYDREEHFKRCIDSLLLNELAKESHLFIAIDAPYKDEHKEVNIRILKYAENISGFKKITLIIRKKNLGSYNNIHEAIREVFEEYSKIIFFEDDNIFSPDFLSFVNRGLNVYQDREDIFSISGYKFPINIPLNYNKDIFIWPGFVAWGFGIWKEKWNKVDWSIIEVKKHLADKHKTKQLYCIAEHNHRHLVNILRTGKITGDTMISLHIFNNNMYSVFPTISRVRNIGHDGKGEHCVKSAANVFHNQDIYTESENTKFPFDIEPDTAIYKQMKKYSKEKFKTKAKKAVKNILRTLKLYNK